jgi:hypothetical protein
MSLDVLRDPQVAILPVFPLLSVAAVFLPLDVRQDLPPILIAAAVLDNWSAYALRSFFSEILVFFLASGSGSR